VKWEFEVNWAVIQVGYEVGSSKAARETVIQPMMQLHSRLLSWQLPVELISRYITAFPAVPLTLFHKSGSADFHF